MASNTSYQTHTQDMTWTTSAVQSSFSLYETNATPVRTNGLFSDVSSASIGNNTTKETAMLASILKSSPIYSFYSKELHTTSIIASLSQTMHSQWLNTAYVNQTTIHPNSTLEHVVIMHYIQIGILMTTLTVSLLGNSLVLGVMYRRRRRLSVANFLIANLAVCDLLFVLITPMIIHSLLHSYKWMFGLTICKLVRSALQLGSTVASGIIVVIAIDRYRGISDPLRPRWKKRHASLACLVAWLFGTFSVIPTMIVLTYNPSTQQCHEDWSYFTYKHANKVYSVYLLVFGFLVHVIIIAVLYSKIIKFLRSPQVKFAHSSLTKEYLEKRRKEDLRVTKLLSLVVVAFVICVLPNKVVWVIFDFAGDKLNPKAQEILGYLALLPYPFHVAVNPIIYSIVDVKFRQDVKDMILCRESQRRASFASTLHVSRTSVSMHTIDDTLE